LRHAAPSDQAPVSRYIEFINERIEAGDTVTPERSDLLAFVSVMMFLAIGIGVFAVASKIITRIVQRVKKRDRRVFQG